MKPLLCMLGLHDWRRRERLVSLAEPQEWNEMVLHAGSYYTLRFGQCRRCDATSWRVPPEPPRMPEPLPWRDE